MAALAASRLGGAARVVVVGGGIAGLNCALLLAELRAFREVVLLERHQLTAGTTWHAAGLVGRMASSRRVVELRAYGQRHYERVARETGLETGLKRQGGLVVADSAERLELLRRWQRVQRSAGLASAELLEGPEAVLAKAPLLHVADLHGALYTREDGQINPVDASMAVAKACRARGVQIRERVGVRDVLLDASGRAAGVELEGGLGRLEADAVLLCGGMWSWELARRVGAYVPLWPCDHEYVVTAAAADPRLQALARGHPVVRDYDRGFYLKEDAGRLLVGFFETNARAAFRAAPAGPTAGPTAGPPADAGFLELPADHDHLDPWLERAMHRVPALQELPIQRYFCGPESFTPDGTELIGETPEVPRLFLCTGMNSHGIVCSPAVALEAARIVSAGGTRRLRQGFLANDVARFQRWAKPELESKMLQAAAVASLGGQYDVARRMTRVPVAPGVRAAGESPFREAQARRGAVTALAPNGLELPRCFPAVGETAWQAAGREAVAAVGSCGLLDVSDRARFQVRGPGAGALLQRFLLYHPPLPGDRVNVDELIADGGWRSGWHTVALNEAGGVRATPYVARADLRAKYGPSEFWLQVPGTVRRRTFVALRELAAEAGAGAQSGSTPAPGSESEPEPEGEEAMHSDSSPWSSSSSSSSKMRSKQAGQHVEVMDHSDEFFALALCGPGARAVVERALGNGKELLCEDGSEQVAVQQLPLPGQTGSSVILLPSRECGDLDEMTLLVPAAPQVAQASAALYEALAEVALPIGSLARDMLAMHAGRVEYGSTPGVDEALLPYQIFSHDLLAQDNELAVGRDAAGAALETLASGDLPRGPPFVVQGSTTAPHDAIAGQPLFDKTGQREVGFVLQALPAVPGQVAPDPTVMLAMVNERDTELPALVLADGQTRHAVTFHHSLHELQAPTDAPRLTR